ncbi:MAG: hypothetical protein J0H19_07330 [Rhodospirillales bacterium]|nr:hypothetical protein [Rhodospirillales bacterium]MBN8926418.1 hypothetical protein [Rhodospirillales bacterium]
MASKHLDERPGRAANGGARPKNGEDEDSVVVRVVEEFLVAQSHCSRANVEATLGTFLPVSPSLLGYDRARAAREDAFLRLRKSAARGLGGLAAKRVVLLTLIGLLGSEDPKIFDYAVELVEEYHAALVAVWPEDRVPSQSLQAGWLETSLDPLPHLVSKTGA